MNAMELLDRWRFFRVRSDVEDLRGLSSRRVSTLKAGGACSFPFVYELADRVGRFC